MKRALLTAFVLAAITTCRAQSFEYLTFEKADGTLVSIPAEGLTLTFADGNLVSSDGTTIPLTSLSKMFFTETSGIATVQANLPEGAVDAYTPSGIHVGTFGDTRDALNRLPKGFYVIRDTKGNILKTAVR